MKFCPVVPEIWHGQVHGAQKKRRRIRITRYDYNLTIMKSPKPATDNSLNPISSTFYMWVDNDVPN
jgi:hypothetical protein